MIEQLVMNRWKQLEDSLQTDEWKILFPGKILFARFASATELQPGYLRNLYIAAARKRNLEPFSDLVEIFKTWSNTESTSSTNSA
jgi:hypothetical protein